MLELQVEACGAVVGERTYKAHVDEDEEGDFRYANNQEVVC